MSKPRKPRSPEDALNMSFDRLNYWSSIDSTNQFYEMSHIGKKDADIAAKTIDRIFDKTGVEITLLPRLEDGGSITITFEAYDGFDFEIAIDGGVISRVHVVNFLEEDNEKLLSLFGL